MSLKKSHSSYWHESLGLALAFIQNVWKDRGGTTVDSVLSVIRYACEVTPLFVECRVDVKPHLFLIQDGD